MKPICVFMEASYGGESGVETLVKRNSHWRWGWYLITQCPEGLSYEQLGKSCCYNRISKKKKMT